MTGTCQLCLTENADLRDSHFLPRSFYKLMRTEDYPPVHISEESVYSSVKQVKDYVFCGDCEQIFGRAEAWIKPLLPAVGGPFSLRERLLSVSPVKQVESGDVYETAANPAIDVAKLSHFAIGVFLKAAVHFWQVMQGGPYMRLEPEEVDALRSYLLGKADLPENMALCVTVDSLPVVWQAMIQPYRIESLRGLKRYIFYVPGIAFQLFIGENARDIVPDNFIANPGHPILVEDVSHTMRNAAREMTANARKAAAVEKSTSEIEAKGLSIRLDK